MKFTLNKKNFLRYLLIVVFLSTTLCFAIKFLGYKEVIPWNIGYNDVMPWNKKAFEPGIPYIDKNVEYPVIIGMTMYLASRVDLSFYVIFHYFIFLISALISTIYLYRLSEKLGTKKKFLFLFWALAPSLLWFVYFNWDIITVMFTIIALYYYKEKRDILATIFLSLGFTTKMYPVLIILPVLMHRRFPSWIKNIATFSLTFLAVNIFFILNNFQRWYFIYRFHGNRPPNIDSIWHILIEFIPGLNIKTINLITLVAFASIYLYINIRFRDRDFIYISFISILLFLLINKVFSPQYILWLLPFFALYPISLGKFYVLEFTNLLVLFTTLTHIFSRQEFTDYLIFSGIFVIIRHIVLIFIFMAAIKRCQISS